MSCGKNCLGYVDSLLFKCGLDKPNSMSWINYLRMRWCIVLYLIFALMGVIPLFILAGSSCNTEISTIEVAGPQPIDVFFCMDTSQSLSVQEWIDNQAAVASLMDVFTLKTNERNSSLQLGYVTFAGAWWSNNLQRFSNESLRDLNNLTANVDFIRGDVQNLPDTNYLELGTNFDEPFMECQRQFKMHGQDGALEVCVLVTDGKDLWPDGCLRHDFVDRICGSDPKPIAAEMKETENVMILGVYIGENDESAALIFNLSSCSEIPGATRGNCTWEVDAEDSPSLQASAEEIVSSVVDTLNEKYFIQLENCIDPEHAVLLLMIVPLILAVIVSIYLNCIKARETIIRKIAISDLSPSMIPPNLDQEPAPMESKRVGRATAISTINFNGAWKSGGYIYVQDRMTQEEVVQEELKKFLMCIMPCCTFVVFRRPSNSNSRVLNTKTFNTAAGKRRSRPDQLSVISKGNSIESQSTGASTNKIQRSTQELSTRSLQSQGTDNRALPAPPGGYRNRNSAPALPPRAAPALPPRPRNTINTKSPPPSSTRSLPARPKSIAPSPRSNKSKTVTTRPLPSLPKPDAPTSKTRSQSRPLPPHPVIRSNRVPSLPPRPNVKGSPGRRSRASLPPISQDRVPPPAPRNSDSQLYKI